MREEAGGGAVVDLPGESPRGVVGIGAAPEGKDRPVAADRAAGLLNPAVLVEKLGDGGAHVVGLRRLGQRLEPAGMDDRVAVQEAEEAAAGLLRAQVA